MEIRHTSLYWIWGMLLNSGLRLSPPPSNNQSQSFAQVLATNTHKEVIATFLLTNVFFCHVQQDTATALLSHVNRTSLAYWLGCSPSPCPPWLICIGFQVYNDVVRNDHYEPLAEENTNNGVQKTMTFNFKIAGTQEPTDICRVQIWFLALIMVNVECQSHISPNTKIQKQQLERAAFGGKGASLDLTIKINTQNLDDDYNRAEHVAKALSIQSAQVLL